MLPFRRECPMTQKLVSKKELRIVFGVPYSFAHIARLEAAGQFPKRIRLGACRVAWLAEEVQDWIDERGASRHTTSPSGRVRAPGSNPALFCYRPPSADQGLRAPWRTWRISIQSVSTLKKIL